MAVSDDVSPAQPEAMSAALVTFHLLEPQPQLRHGAAARTEAGGILLEVFRLVELRVTYSCDAIQTHHGDTELHPRKDGTGKQGHPTAGELETLSCMWGVGGCRIWGGGGEGKRLYVFGVRGTHYLLLKETVTMRRQVLPQRKVSRPLQEIVSTWSHRIARGEWRASRGGALTGGIAELLGGTPGSGSHELETNKLFWVSTHV